MVKESCAISNNMQIDITNILFAANNAVWDDLKNSSHLFTIDSNMNCARCVKPHSISNIAQYQTLLLYNYLKIPYPARQDCSSFFRIHEFRLNLMYSQ